MESRLNLLAAAAAQTVATLEELKAQTRVKHAKEDGVLLACLEAAVDWAQEFTDRELRIGGKYALWLSAFPRDGTTIVRLPKPPCVSVDFVRYTDSNGDAQVLAAGTDYVTSLPTGPFAMPGRVAPAYAQRWPLTRAQMDAVKIEFTAGYVAQTNPLPVAAKQAVLILAAEMFANRTEAVIGTISSPVQVTAERLLYPLRVFGTMV